MKIAIIGQSIFATSVYRLLQQEGHEIVGVFTILDSNGREDHVATSAKNDGVPIFKVQRFDQDIYFISKLLDYFKST